MPRGPRLATKPLLSTSKVYPVYQRCTDGKCDVTTPLVPRLQKCITGRICRYALTARVISSTSKGKYCGGHERIFIALLLSPVHLHEVDLERQHKLRITGTEKVR